MGLVKKIIVFGLLIGVFSLCADPAGGLADEIVVPQAPAATETAPRPARADLAEAVFAMVLDRAKMAGMEVAQPVSLCQACVAAHLGLPEETTRSRCQRACGLR